MVQVCIDRRLAALPTRSGAAATVGTIYQLGLDGSGYAGFRGRTQPNGNGGICAADIYKSTRVVCPINADNNGKCGGVENESATGTGLFYLYRRRIDKRGNAARNRRKGGSSPGKCNLRIAE